MASKIVVRYGDIGMTTAVLDRVGDKSFDDTDSIAGSVASASQTQQNPASFLLQ